MPKSLSSSSDISSGKPAVYTKITSGSGIKSDLSHRLMNNRGVSGASLPCSSPGTGHCWKQETGFEGPVAGHSAVPLLWGSAVDGNQGFQATLQGKYSQSWMFSTPFQSQ